MHSWYLGPKGNEVDARRAGYETTNEVLQAEMKYHSHLPSVGAGILHGMFMNARAVNPRGNDFPSGRSKFGPS